MVGRRVLVALATGFALAAWVSAAAGAAAPEAMVDGGPVAEAAAPEALSSAPTPPKGAEPAAERSPAPVVAGADDAPRLAEPTATSPSALGLSPDANRGAPAVAPVGFALLLLLVAHQFVERSDPRLDVVRAAEGIAGFR